MCGLRVVALRGPVALVVGEPFVALVDDLASFLVPYNLRVSVGPLAQRALDDVPAAGLAKQGLPAANELDAPARL